MSGPDVIGNTSYATKCKELMALRNDLNEMGANGLLDLPRVVVIGGQSAGKSSLVEGVSGINVPRDSGTCTRRVVFNSLSTMSCLLAVSRCPMECVMHSTTESWHCTISLRSEESLGTTTPFGPEITDKASVEIWLRRAQAACLSPHRPSSNFLNMSREKLRKAYANDASMLKFTSTVVCLDLHDPEATDLSFVDLPGLIQNETPEAIALVQNLVVSYISRPNTLILVTIPMTDDMENQLAVRLAREADPEGTRTIGVITKPDCLHSGAIDARERWKSIMLGLIYPLHHGYYCVRLPDDSERHGNLSRTEAQQRATLFFQKTAPWKDPEMNRGRFGIPNLVEDLSRLLVELIEAALPSLKKQVEDLLTLCLNEIKTLPPGLTREPQTEVLIRINNFCREYGETVDAKINKHYVQENRAAYAALRCAIRNTTPDFRPFRKHWNCPIPTYSCEEPVDDETLEDGTLKDGDLKRYQQPMYLEDIREVIQKSTGWELPGHVPYQATTSLIKRYIALWETPALQCFDRTFGALTRFMDQLQAEHFSRFRPLRHHVQGVSTAQMEERKRLTLASLRDILDREAFPIFTQNVHYFQTNCNKWQAEYTHFFQHPPSLSPPSPFPQSVSHTLPAIELKTQEELKVMANVRAYLQVANKRFIDAVPLAIEHKLNAGLSQTLNGALIESIFEGENRATRMKDLVAESPELDAKRKELADRKARLEVIHHRLEDFESS